METFPFNYLLKNLDTLNNLNWIFYKEFKVINEDEFTPDFYTYIIISDKGDIIYISTDEYKLNNEEKTINDYFIKRRINTDDIILSNIDFKHVDFTDEQKYSVISKKTLILTVDNIVTQKIRNLLIN